VRFDTNSPRRIQSGTVITLSGRLRESELFVLAATLESGAGGSGASGPSIPSVSATGNQQALVMLTNFSDVAVSCSVDTVNNIMFSDPNSLSVNALYRDASRGQLGWSGSVVGPFTIPGVSTDQCDLWAWAAAADAQASASGVALADYARKLYVMPPNSCPGAGFGTVGGSPSAAWVFACDVKGLYSHELGHNLGLDHASTPLAEYGDGTDPMSTAGSRLRGINAPHRQQLGWISGEQMQVVRTNGTYEVAPLSRDPGAVAVPQALLIPKPDTDEYYYLSYRLAEGFDNYIDLGYHNRISVHRYKGDGSPSNTYLLTGLDDGQQFADAANGITLTMVRHDSTTATVDIAFASPCVAAVPSLALSPQVQSGPPGTSATYTLSVTNHDSSLCDASSVTLTASVPTSWSGALSAETLTLEPGTTGQATLTLTAAQNAAPSTYNAVISAADAAEILHSSSVTAFYDVLAPCVRAAPTVSAAPSIQTGIPGTTVAYDVTITNHDSAQCGASTYSLQRTMPAGWAGSFASSSLALEPGYNTTVSLWVTSSAASASGLFNVAISVSDPLLSGHNASATAQYAVEAPADATPPTVPSGLTATANSKLKRIQLVWNASSDNVGVAGYRVLRNGVVAGVVTTTSWIDLLWVTGATYQYTVVAYDAAGNVSSPTNAGTLILPGGKKR
jgi:hypothetical protein